MIKLYWALFALAVLPDLIYGKTPGWPSPYWDIPGDYCRARYPQQRCCEGRNDPCSVPILGTLCYCDRFCNRTDSSDCCPDYFSHCEGLDDLQYAEQPPEEIVRQEDLECPHGVRTDDGDPKCYDQGNYYSTRDVVKKNCNQCRCQVSLGNPRCMELLCETEECFMDGDLFDRLEDEYYRGGIHWKPKNNSVFWGHSVEEIASKRLGTKLPEEQDKRMFDMIPIKFNYDPDSFPAHFDARDKWGDRIHPILDQGWCAASWAFSTISIASDRMSIDTEGEINHQMSPQSLISCNTHGQFGCNGGYIDRAWHFLRKFGTVPESCYGYEEGQSSCQLPRSAQHDVLKPAFLDKFEILRTCPNLKGRRGLFKMQPSYRVGRTKSSRHPRRTEHDIMFEIMTHGPVQAIMEVYKDLFLYGSGVYERSYQVPNQVLGHHSVKIIGWGTEKEIDYWLVANSWGTEWGDSGFFKIRRGSNECSIESQVVGAWAQTQEVSEEIEKFRQRNPKAQRQRRSRIHQKNN